MFLCLSKHLLEIHGKLKAIASNLRNKGQKAVVVIATDGLPTTVDGKMGTRAKEEFVHCLRLFQALPVWIVVRLCTNDQAVVEFYNNLDHEVELSVEVIDDFQSEAQEARSHNKWLCYSLPLHRCREFGFHDPLFDIIDERSLTKIELRLFCATLFDKSYIDIPDPENYWSQFIKVIRFLQRDETKQYNPVKRCMTPWIDFNELEKHYNPWSYNTYAFVKALSAVIIVYVAWILSPW